MDNLARLAQRYVEAVERGDQFAHARGLELAEAVLGASEARETVLDALEEPLRTVANELDDEARQLLMTAVDRLREESKTDGRRAMLLRQLETRFGTLPDDVSRRLRFANADQLDEWADRILSAESLNEVFGSGAP